MLIRGDARSIPLRDGSVHCVVSSPPYWGLRDYGTPGQIGLEASPAEYVEALVAVFREVRRVLRADGTLWLNLGDSYAGAAGGGQGKNSAFLDRAASRFSVRESTLSKVAGGLKPKDLVGIPWRVALALQADGWWLRSDIIWSKPNPMPESITDRPTKAHEYVFLLAKSERYYFDGEALRERSKEAGRVLDYTGSQKANTTERERQRTQPKGRKIEIGDTRNVRTVWTIPSQPYPGAHFACMPPALARRCILAGCPPRGLVLDPFVGSGTTVRVARDLGREGLGLDMNGTYLHEQAAQRVRTTAGMGW